MEGKKIFYFLFGLIFTLFLLKVGFAQDNSCNEILARRGDLLAKYDLNKNLLIDKEESDKANQDWISGVISGSDLLDIVRFGILKCKLQVSVAEEPTSPCDQILASKGDLMRSYDLNKNGLIDRDEVDRAAKDWLEGKIKGDDLLDIIKFSLLGCKIPSDKWVKVILPNGGEKLELGKSYQIKWESKKVSKVDIDLLRGKLVVLNIAKEVASSDGSNNTYSWTPEKGKVLPEEYFLRIKDSSDPKIVDTSDKPFSIVTPCERKKPIVNLWPQKATRKAGESAEYTVFVVNEDSYSCEASDFAILATCPSGWTCNLSQSKVNLKPHTKTSVKLAVHSPANASFGEYEISVKVTHQADTSLSAEDKVKFIISKPQEDPVSGRLSVNKREITQGEEITLRIEAQDEQGVEAAFAYFKGDWNKFDCKFEKKCTATFTFKEENIGMNYYYGYVAGKKVDGSRETNWTIPPFVVVKVNPIKPSLKVLVPNGGEIWKVGETYEIKWESSQVDKINIELFAGEKKAQTIAENVSAGDKSYKWTIPQTISSGKIYRVKIYDSKDSSVSDVSDRPFAIEAPAPPRPEVKVITPNGGEKWKIGETQEIKWESSNIEKVNIELFVFSRKEATIATEISAKDGVYKWTIPSSIPPRTTYKVKISDSSKSSVYDFSDRTFTIEKPTPP
jgi:hypothetical protein